MNTRHKRALFIDRDGVIVKEDQVDTFEKIIYIPHVFEALRKLSVETDYSLVMVSNQDGVGTPSFLYDDYIKVQNRILETLRGEGIVFDDINVDFSLPEDNCPGRKPKIGMLGEYLSGEWDLEHSFVIGDRLSDMVLAKNLGCRGFLLNDDALSLPEDLKSTVVLKGNWLDILSYLTDSSSLKERKAFVERVTKETKVSVRVNLDGVGDGFSRTGIGFLDHMLDELRKHSRIDMEIEADGDLYVDEHHTMEDVAITLGEAIRKALSDKRGIERYGYYRVVMDSVVASAAIDFSSRPDLVFDVKFTRDYIGKVPTEMFYHFFKSFSNSSLSSLYIEATQGDSHHMAEAIFKAFARSLRMAVKRIPGDSSIPTTKGVL